jgi:Enoyl-CoA hydratase/isomerase
VTDPGVLAWPELQDWLAAEPALLPNGDPAVPVLFVDLDASGSPAQATSLLQAITPTPPTTVLVGLARHAVRPELVPLTEALTCTLVAGGREPVPAAQIAVPRLGQASRAIAATAVAAPKAAATLAGLLRLTSDIPVDQGLVAESLAYSMLLAGPEFARWRAARPARAPASVAAPAPAEPVLLDRAGDELRVTLNDPARHNAFSRHVRDGLAEALDVALADPSITAIRLTGRGPSFCSGGDLDEFGTTPDVVAAHLIRLERSVAVRAERCRDRLRPVLHGACIGAGLEIPSFAAWVEARDDTFFQLPELAMGLIPGAGGTVSLPRRIGRWRTAYLALSGLRLDLPTALTWGLVDVRIP